MTEAQAAEIRELKQQIHDLQQKLDALESLRDKLLGVGVATRWAIKIVVTLIGVGGLAALARVIDWLSQPIKTH